MEASLGRARATVGVSLRRRCWLDTPTIAEHPASSHAGGWTEIGDRVFVRIRLLDHIVQARRDVLGPTSTSRTRGPGDLRESGAGHGRRRHPRPFRPCLRQPRLPARRRSGVTRAAVRFMERTGEARGRRIAAEEPELAADLDRGRHRPARPDLHRDRLRRLGDRQVELRFLGRGHTDHDIVIRVPDAGVLFAGDLHRERHGALLRRRLPARLAGDRLPGRRARGPCRRAGPRRSRWPTFRGRAGGRVRGLADLARRVTRRADDRRRPRGDALPGISAEEIRRPIERALGQLRGELD